MDFKSKKAKQLITEEAYLNAAEDLNCDVAAIKAVADVESRGDGYLSDGRPKILFERHKFRNYTNSRFDENYPDISGFRGGYLGDAAEYDRLSKAIQLDCEAALKSASWGRFQIMGFNYAVCGFSDIESFVEAMVESEDRQLEAFISFVEGNNLDRHLRSHNWARFARGYNGPGYRENNYHTKMARAYEKYASEPRPSRLVSLAGNISQADFQVDSVRDLQRALDFLGISPGVIDNQMGPKTCSAIKTFQRFAHLPQTGEYESSLRAAVQSAYYMMKNFELLSD
ncbi:N-acetylmuramidase domain-containing protein [Vibrio sp. JC009]|uniref:N-acetylmuramidase domain-containing protein n=1 Tax=Vibrio sp. JC009 TaxID=2912314 RepID=UPI0023B1BB2B|nr:N-acetylmuramidase domain-containing protein [Vibrio sp. JC009]WED21491.1 N-acetylmuramidase domain-containing protein [Vibrio sp. JC009]